jgi:hypothetical protein
MHSAKAVWRLGCGLAVVSALFAFQRPFHQYPGVEYFEFDVPSDWNQGGEYAFARLMFPPGPLDGYYPRFQGDWHKGLSLWTQDYPRADRHFSLALRRLTRLQVRSVEQPVDLEDNDEVFNFPWLYAVQVGEWGLSENEAKILREYLLRGGFFMADDFHGIYEWQEFEKRIKYVFPDRPIVDLDNDNAIFHTVYDMDDRFQIPGQAHLRLGYKANGPDSIGAHWRGILDDKGRVMVAITYNSDVGDAWEYADDPYYPEKFSGLAIRIGVNYVMYSMTH